MMLRIQEGVDRMHRFNSNAAHEMRTPLNAIRSRIEVTLEKARTSAEYEEVLRESLAQVQHLAEGVGALLRLSRSEAGLDPESLERVSLATLLETLIEFFEPVASDRGITLDAAAFPVVDVEGDASWLRRLFSNLVDNAIKYSSEGCHVHLSAELKDGGVLVRVADDGPGIPHAELEGIFDRFQRGEEHRHRPGFGLGLPLAREIARAHGGWIDVRNAPGRGCTFGVWLQVSSQRAHAGS